MDNIEAFRNLQQPKFILCSDFFPPCFDYTFQFSRCPNMPEVCSLYERQYGISSVCEQLTCDSFTTTFMRWHSTPQSALNGEITKLAIIECAFSVALYLAICIHFGTFKYLAWTVVVAPLMLFRTETSAVWGLVVFNRTVSAMARSLDYLRDRFRVLALLFIVPMCIGIGAIGSAIRIVATVYWVVRMPLQSLREAPHNWLRQSLCTDFFHPPEMMPMEITKIHSTFPTYLWGRLELELKIASKSTRFFVILLLVGPFVLLGYLPALVYRISFKATAIAYAPFIWVAHTTLENPLSVKTRLERITKGELEKVRRAASWSILAVLGAKIGLAYGFVDLSNILARFPSQKLMNSLVVPGSWPWWQFTLGMEALLTFALLFFADAALARLDGEHTWKSGTVLNFVSVISFVRATLGIVTMSYAFWCALALVAPNLPRRFLQMFAVVPFTSQTN